MASKRKSGAKLGGHRPKIRAHRNPLAESDFDYPVTPQRFATTAHFPDAKPGQAVTVADVGCGFGGLLENLAPVLPDDLILGMEIRPQVTEIVQKRIEKLRTSATESKDANSVPYTNISVVLTNAMKYIPNYFAKGQLRKIFFCFPDPHFKKKMHRRRIINKAFLDVYAYVLQVGGLLYSITDVKDLHDWTMGKLIEHPLFEQIEHKETDPVVQAMCTTDEGNKVNAASVTRVCAGDVVHCQVTRNKGAKYIAVFQRLAAN